MANSIVQIRRSNTTATPTTTLNGGELAYSYNTNSLFIGAQTGIGGTGFRVGGAAYQYLFGVTPGTLPATGTIITDANSYVSNIFSQGLAIQTSTASAPGVFISSMSNNGTGGFLGANASGGGIGTELATTAAISTYVTGKLSGSTVGGVNTQIQFNNSGAFGGTAGFTFISTTNTVSIGNTTVNSTINSTALVGTSVILTGTVNTATVFATGLVNAANFVTTGTVNTGTVFATGLVNAANFVTTGTVNTGTLFATGQVNGSTFTTTGAVNGATFNATTSANVGANVQLTTTVALITGNVIVNSTVNTTANSILGGGTLNLSYWNGNSTVNTYSNVFANGTTIVIGNSAVNLSINSTSFSGTANNALFLGGTAAAAFVQNNFTGSLTGAAITFSGTSTTFSTNVTHSANTTLNGANTLIASTNVAVTGNTTLAGTNTVVSSNLTISGGLITAASTNATFNLVTAGSMVVSGNLTVSGTVETINTSELVVNANFIELGANNKSAATDIVDIGFFGTANASGPTSPYYPLFGRIASKSSNTNAWFWLGTSNTNPNTATTFDIGAANATVGTLQSYLSPWGAAGAFLVNSTAIAITANSTVAATITANTLTLATALGAGSGGTGKLSAGYTAGDLLYAATSSPTALTSLAITANGNVLQVLNNLPAWGGIDGGTF